MGRLFDSFWRAAAYCMLPRVMVLSMLPLVLVAVAAAGVGYWFWDAWVEAARHWLQAPAWLDMLWRWLQGLGWEHASDAIAPVLVLVVVAPLLVIVSLLVVSLFMTPALVALVARRRFPALEARRGANAFASVSWSVGSTLMALLALVVSVPLWLIPPLILVLPPLVGGWLTYRVMAFDALSEHASKAERTQILQRHRGSLLAMGVITGYLSAAPSLVWASGLFFAAAFVVLIPLAVWIYTLVFAFSSLWFAHFCLQALAQLRAENPGPDGAAPLVPVVPSLPGASVATSIDGSREPTDRFSPPQE